jgi:polysaccharide biosynthesis protein PslJ
MSGSVGVDERPSLRRGRLAQPRAGGRPRRDVVSLLTVFLIVGFAIPSPLIFKPLGGSGTPADLLGLGFLLWWGLAKLGSAQGVDRGRQPVRVALLILMVAVLASMAAMFLSPFTGEQANGAYRGLVMFVALSGVSLLAADGISSLERLHTLMHRFVAGVSMVAGLGLIQWLTGYNPAATLAIPGLTRNIDLTAQGRSSFVRVQSTTVHPIELGSLLGITLPIAVSYALLAKDRRTKLIRWAEVAVIAVVIPMALSRTAVIAAGIGMLAIAMDWTWARRGRVAMATAGFLVAMRLAIPGLVGSVISLFSNFGEDTSTKDRAGRWQMAGHYFELHPWFGMGVNTFYPVTGLFYDNQYLAVASEMGAVGLAALLLLFVITTFTARGARLRSVDPESRALAQALAGVSVAMMVIFMTADMFSFAMEMEMYFLLVGVTGALWRLTGGQQGGVPPRRPGAQLAVTGSP